MKIGQKVKVVKKADISHDSWVNGMDKYIGQTVTIREIGRNNTFGVSPVGMDAIGYMFSKESLELIN
jgi:hypothetical protein